MALTMEREVAQKLDAFRESVTITGEQTVFRTFPEKILSLQGLIDSTSSTTSIFHVSNAIKHTDPTVYLPPNSNSNSKDTAGEGSHAKKRKREDGPEAVVNNGTSELSTANNDTSRCVYSGHLTANMHMMKLHDVIRGEAQELSELVDKVKLWVNLTMPKIEDGDNFGVQIQEEVLNELHRAQESAYNLRDAVRLDHLTRAKICSKLLKYPNIEDYTIALKDHDEKQHFLARQHLVDLRNLYAVLTDLIHKNITKVRAPKANNGIGLY